MALGTLFSHRTIFGSLLAFHRSEPTLLGVRQLCQLLVVFLLAVVLTGCTGRDIIGTAKGWTPVAVNEGVLYVASVDGAVLAIGTKALDNYNSPDPIWVYRPTDGLGSVFGPPAIGQDLVYVGGSIDDGNKGRLVALRKDPSGESGGISPGTRVWGRDLPGAIIGGPALAPGIVLVGSEDGNLYAFRDDVAKGGEAQELWTFPTEGLREDKDKEKRIWSTPVVADGVVYFGALDGYLYAVSLEQGLNSRERLLWKFKTGGAIVTTPLVHDNKVFFGSFDRKFYALDANNGGTLLWSFKADSWFWASPVTDGRLVFAPSTDGKIYALDIKRGQNDLPSWSLDLGDDIISTPFLAGDILVVASGDGKIYRINIPEMRMDKTPLEIGKEVRVPLRGDGSNKVYLGDRDGRVHSIDLKDWGNRSEPYSTKK